MAATQGEKKREGREEEGTQPSSNTDNGSMEIKLWTACFKCAEKSVKSNFPQVLLCWGIEYEMWGNTPVPAMGRHTIQWFKVKSSSQPS